jgi:hypothetical protein
MVQTEPLPKKPELQTQSRSLPSVASAESAEHAAHATAPSPKYPALHTPQLKEASLLTHGALSEQVSVCSAHSLMSEHELVASPVQPVLHTQSSELTSQAVQSVPSGPK